MRFRVGYLAVLAVAAVALATRTTPAQDRTGDEIAQEMDATQPPVIDPARRSDAQYMREQRKLAGDAMLRWRELAWELVTKWPEHERAPQAAKNRWRMMLRENQSKATLTQIAGEATALMTGTGELASEARYAYAIAKGMESGWDPAGVSDAVEAFIEGAPDDERGAYLLDSMARVATAAEAKRELYERIVHMYAGASMARFVPGKIRQMDEVGKPFELAFEDALTGEAFDIKDHLGKIVVVWFWAHESESSRSGMPQLVKMEAKYLPRNVQFVGVNLDKPELVQERTTLLSYLGEKGVEWPQFFQSDGWNSGFSLAWGVDALPMFFLIDHEGNLVNTDAGPELEANIEALLTARDGPADVPATGDGPDPSLKPAEAPGERSGG